MAGSAAGRDADGDRNREAAGTLRGEAVEMWGVGRLKLAAARCGVRETSQSIDDGEDDLGVVGRREFAKQVEIHGPLFYVMAT